MANSYGPKSIVTQGIIFAADAGNIQCFTQGASTCKDLIQGSTGTLTNQATYSPEGGGSWELDGSSDDVDFGDVVPVVADLEYDSSFTWMQWHNQDTIGVYQGLLTRMQSGGNYRGIRQVINDSNRYMVDLRHDGSSYIRKTGTSTAFAGNIWYMCAFTYNGSTDASGITMYVNGEVESASTNADTLGNDTLKGYDLVLGDVDGGSLDMDGKTTLALIYNRALTAAEIKQNYNATKTRFGL